MLAVQLLFVLKSLGGKYYVGGGGVVEGGRGSFICPPPPPPPPPQDQIMTSTFLQDPFDAESLRAFCEDGCLDMFRSVYSICPDNGTLANFELGM